VDVICSNATIGSVVGPTKREHSILGVKYGIGIRIFGSCHLALSVGLAGSPNNRSDFGGQLGLTLICGCNIFRSTHIFL